MILLYTSFYFINLIIQVNIHTSRAGVHPVNRYAKKLTIAMCSSLIVYPLLSLSNIFLYVLVCFLIKSLLTLGMYSWPFMAWLGDVFADCLFSHFYLLVYNTRLQVVGLVTLALSLVLNYLLLLYSFNCILCSRSFYILHSRFPLPFRYRRCHT